MTDDKSASPIARRVQRAALTLGVYLSIGLGPTLVMLPVVPLFTPDADLLIQKFITVMGGVAIVVASGLGIWLLGALARRRVLSLRQSENDRLALKIMSDLRASRATRVPEFYLYLRAFETTGRLHVPLFLRLRKLSIGLNRLVTNDVESYVSSAIRRIAPLVALGSTGEAIGAGRIVTDDEHWKADIRVLMDRAKAILLVPSNRPGTMWEIETLKNTDLLHKVIFVMPPRSTGGLDTRDRWEVARQAMAAHGLDVPDYQDRGLLFVVGPSGKISNVEPMLLPSPRQVRKSLTRLLSSDQTARGLFKAVAAAERRSRRATFWGWSETARQLSPYAVALIALFSTQSHAGFDPRESWSVVFDRFVTMGELSRNERSVKLAASDKYRLLEAQVPPDNRDEWRGAMLVRGLPRISDAQLRAYDVAYGEMLARIDTGTCAAILKGTIQPDALATALSYIPSAHVNEYLNAGTAAILAAVEERPIPAPDAAATASASEQFVARLGPDGQQRFERITQAPGPPSDEDRCWLGRAMYAAVANLPPPHATVWARDVAASSLPNDAIADAARTPAPDHQADQQPRAQVAPPPSKSSGPATAAVAPPEPRVPEPEQPSVARNPDPPARAGTGASPTPEVAPRPSYPRLLDDASAAIRVGRLAEASEVIDQLIQLDPARGEGWSLRGMIALDAGALAVARESYANALARGGAVAFRLVHDHGAGQPPCVGTMLMTPTTIEFTPTAGEHRFQWPYPAIREAAINDIYGSQLGMFHIKAQMTEGTKTFNFVVVRTNDQRIVNRKPEAEMLLGLLNRRRTPG